MAPPPARVQWKRRFGRKRRSNATRFRRSGPMAIGQQVADLQFDGSDRRRHRAKRPEVPRNHDRELAVRGSQSARVAAPFTFIRLRRARVAGIQVRRAAPIHAASVAVVAPTAADSDSHEEAYHQASNNRHDFPVARHAPGGCTRVLLRLMRSVSVGSRCSSATTYARVAGFGRQGT